MSDGQPTTHPGAAQRELRRPSSSSQMAAAADRTPAGTAVLLHGFAALPIMNLPLARALSRAGFETRGLGYDSWGKSLQEICEMLAPHFARIADDTPGPLHVVGHSMGGLVARALINRQRPARFGHLVMLGTPNAGSEVADFVAQWPLTRPILGKAAPALLTQRPASLDALLGQIDYSVGIVAGNRSRSLADRIGLFSGPSDGKVSVASTRLPEAADHIVLPLSHALLLYHPEAHRQVRHFLRHGSFVHGQRPGNG